MGHFGSSFNKLVAAAISWAFYKLTGCLMTSNVFSFQTEILVKNSNTIETSSVIILSKILRVEFANNLKKETKIIYCLKVLELHI